MMSKKEIDSTVGSIRRAVMPAQSHRADEALLRLVGDADLVLLGEATHGTHEFYLERARITRKLIEEKSFCAVAVEADWPDAYRINHYVRGSGSDRSAERSLSDFHRFPRWMWRNTEVLEFVKWLRSHNDQVSDGTRKAGFYGLDLYSLFGSMEAVIAYLDRVDPAGAKRARERYACFDHFGLDPQGYGYHAGLGLGASCEEETIDQLMDLRRRSEAYLRRNGFAAEDELFFADQNARLVRNAEEYYRSMYKGDAHSWNLRDRHMAETIETLMGHLRKRIRNPKIVVWEHNSHVGNALATEMSARGEWNVGQLVRARYGPRAVLIGFTTYEGTVAAASDWDSPVEKKKVRPALSDSYEALFHAVHPHDFFLIFRGAAGLGELLEPRLERAIGVVYRPETERRSHYFHAKIIEQFDAVVHFDRTHAVRPLERTTEWDSDTVPETYPFSI